MSHRAQSSEDIKSLVQKLERKCFIKGILVSSKAVELIVRRRLLCDGRSERLLTDCADELCTEDSDLRSLISLQAIFSDPLDAEDTERCLLAPLEAAICDVRPTCRQDLLRLVDLMVCHCILHTGLGDPTCSDSLHETRGALESFLCPADLEKFCACARSEKQRMLTEISEVAAGVRLFCRSHGRSQQRDIVDYPGLLSEYLKESQRRLRLHLDEVRAWLSPLARRLNRRLGPPVSTSAVRSLLLKQQILAYLKVMFFRINELAVNFEKSLEEYRNDLQEIYMLTEHRFAVPTKVIHPLFIKLSVSYKTFFHQIYILSNFERLLYIILHFFQFDEDVNYLIKLCIGEGSESLNDDSPDELISEEVSQGNGTTGEDRLADKIDPSFIRSRQCTVVFPEMNQFDRLEYNGFDPVWPVLSGGLLLEADPRIGFLLIGDTLVGFSSTSTAYLFAENPHAFHEELMNFVRSNPSYIEIFQLQESLQNFLNGDRREPKEAGSKRTQDTGVQTAATT